MGKVVNGEPPSDQQKLAHALETITDVLVGKKLEALRESIAAMDTRVSDRFDQMKKDSVEAVKRLKKELVSRIEEVQGKLDAAEGRQKEAHGKLDERTREAQEDLKRDLQKSQSKVENKIRTVESEMKKNLLEKEEALRKELDTLSAGLSGIQLEQQDQAQATQDISKVLHNVATVFGQPSGQSPLTSIPDEMAGAPDEVQLDNALDQMFPADDPAMETDQPDRDMQQPKGRNKKK